jgi:hypothetical protein
MGPIVGHGTVRLKQEALRVMASRVNGASAMAAR